MSIHVLSVIMMQMGIFVFTIFCIGICKKLGALDRTVFALAVIRLFSDDSVFYCI